MYDLPSSNTKAAKGATTKGKKAAAPVEEESDVAAVATETLTDILSENGGTLVLAKLKMKVLSKLVKHPERDAVLAHLLDTDNADTYDGVTYTAKTKTFELAE